MRDFDYVAPASLAEAVRRGREPDSRFIDGGTLLVDLMRLNVERPARVIDLSAVLSNEIKVDERGLTIGAGARNSDVAFHAEVVSRWPTLSEALLAGASPQVRNMASVGGNLLQRTRCAYFRDSGVSACNKRNPGSGCAARGGYSRMHALLGVSEHCIALHPSDMCVALLALDAVIRTQRAAGTREIPMAEFHTLPGDHPEHENVLEAGEVVTAVFVPASPRSRRSVYLKVRDRASFAFALVSAAAALELEGGQIKSASLALGGVGTKPWRAREMEAALVGKPATRESFVAAAASIMSAARPTPHNRFKLELAPRVAVRALERAGSLA